MDLTSIEDEYERNGRISRQSASGLRIAVLASDPYSAITVAADTGAVELADAIAECLGSDDGMVRWNAAATLFTRFRTVTYADRCYELAVADPDSMVRSICLVGAGELLPLVTDEVLRARFAQLIDRVVNDESACPEDRSAAYEAMLAAQDVLPADRPTASKIIQIPEDTDESVLAGFRSTYLQAAK